MFCAILVFQILLIQADDDKKLDETLLENLHKLATSEEVDEGLCAVLFKVSYIGVVRLYFHLDFVGIFLARQKHLPRLGRPSLCYFKPSQQVIN